MSAADLTHIETWLFDVDDTLYPAETALMDQIRGRITDFVMRVRNCDWDEARATQREWFDTHGAALPGLLAAHDISVEEFLNEVHDVDLACVPPDPALAAAIERLPGRKLVFTNGSAAHAARVLEKVGLAHLFEDIFHIESAGLIPKPAPATFARMIDAFAISPTETAFFEDSEVNLAHADVLGMTTVLVGAHAAACEARHVHHRAPRLSPFLAEARVREPAL